MNDRLAAALANLGDYTSQHVLLSAAALALGVAISLPLAIASARRPRLRWAVLAVASLVQTIPGLALLALFYPLLLGVSAVSDRLFGFAVPALGFLPSVLALTIYSMLPILRNGVAAMLGLDPAYLEAADGVGMTPWQKLLRVELPLAAPVIMAGIRTAAVWTIGMATLSTTVGQTSLGNFIFSGLQTENWIAVLVGCAAVVTLALIVDQALGLIEAAAVRRDAVRMAAGVAVLVVGTIGGGVSRFWRARQHLCGRRQEFLRAIHSCRPHFVPAGSRWRPCQQQARASGPPSFFERSRAATSTSMWIIRGRCGPTSWRGPIRPRARRCSTKSRGS